MAYLEYPFFQDRPFIPIILTNPINNQSLSTYALVDSGADNCLFPGSLAAALGHNLKDPNVETGQAFGIEANHITTWKHPFIISLAHPKDRSKAVKKMTQCLVECTERNTPPLLGTSNFLKHFTVTILYSKKIIRLGY